VKLLFDENLSPALVVALADIFQESAHAREVGLKSSSDRKVWDYAAEMGYTIITKDADFRQRSFLFLRRRVQEIEAFGLAEEQVFLRLA